MHELEQKNMVEVILPVGSPNGPLETVWIQMTDEYYAIFLSLASDMNNNEKIDYILNVKIALDGDRSCNHEPYVGYAMASHFKGWYMGNYLDGHLLVMLCMNCSWSDIHPTQVGKLSTCCECVGHNMGQTLYFERFPNKFGQEGACYRHYRICVRCSYSATTDAGEFHDPIPGCFCGKY